MTSKVVQKTSFIVILVLLLLFLPFTIYSIYLKITLDESPSIKENKNKEFFFDGKLWFYSSNGNLLGTYTCLHNYCDYGSSYENDSLYAIDYYKSEEESFLPIINEQYVFIRDTDDEFSHEAFLHDLKNQVSFKEATYASVKNYQIGLEENQFIVENQNHEFGLLQVGMLPILTIPYSYQFLGVVKPNVEEKVLSTDYFVALKDDSWAILYKNGDEVSEVATDISTPIVTFNGEYIITENANKEYSVVDYENNVIMDSNYTELYFVSKYLACRTASEFFLYDFVTKKEISQIHPVSSNDSVVVEMKDEETISIKVNKKIVETLSFS